MRLIIFAWRIKKPLVLFYEDNLSTYQKLGPHLRSILPRTSLVDIAQDDPQDWRLRDHANILYNLFPLTSLLVQQDHVVWISQMPLAPNKTNLRIVTLAPKLEMAQRDHFLKNHEITKTTLDEDFDIGESIQANLDSEAVETFNIWPFLRGADRLS